MLDFAGLTPERCVLFQSKPAFRLDADIASSTIAVYLLAVHIYINL